MFTEEQKKAYQSIKAPAGLKEKAISGAGEYNSARKAKLLNIRVYSGIAACLVLVLTFGILSFSGNGGGNALYFDGAAVTETQILVPTPRVMSVTREESVSVMLELRGNDATVEVTDSKLWLDDTEEAVDSFELQGKMRFQWVAFASDDAEFRMSVRGTNDTLTYILSYDAEKNLWTLFKDTASK